MSQAYTGLRDLKHISVKRSEILFNCLNTLLFFFFFCSPSYTREKLTPEKTIKEYFGPTCFLTTVFLRLPFGFFFVWLMFGHFGTWIAEFWPQNPSPGRKFNAESDFQVETKRFWRPGAKKDENKNLKLLFFLPPKGYSLDFLILLTQ